MVSQFNVNCARHIVPQVNGERLRRRRRLNCAVLRSQSAGITLRTVCRMELKCTSIHVYILVGTCPNAAQIGRRHHSEAKKEGEK